MLFDCFYQSLIFWNVSTQIWNFTNISLFLKILSHFFLVWAELPGGESAVGIKILSLNSFDNSWGNLHTKFAILDTTFRFACG